MNSSTVYTPTLGEIEEAKSYPDGWVYRIDKDYDPKGTVPPEAMSSPGHTL